jgi:hypothetical protein
MVPRVTLPLKKRTRLKWEGKTPSGAVKGVTKNENDSPMFYIRGFVNLHEGENKKPPRYFFSSQGQGQG